MIPSKNLDCTIEYIETEAKKHYCVTVKFLDKTRDYLSFSIDPTEKAVSFEEWTDQAKTYTKSEMVGNAVVFLDKMNLATDPEVIDDLPKVGKFVFSAK